MAKQSRVTGTGSASPAAGSAVLKAGTSKRVLVRGSRWKGIGRASGVVAVGVLAALAAPREAKALGYFTDNNATALPGPLPCLDTPGGSLNGGCFTSFVTTADIDGDGDIDILAANGGRYYSVGVAEQSVIYQNDGKGVFTDVNPTKFGNAYNRLRQTQAADIDGDGDLDIYQPGGFGADLDKLWVQTAPGVYENQAATKLPAGLMSHAASAHFGDLDNDGDQDLIVMDWFLSAATTPSRAILYKNDGTGTFTTAAIQNDDGFATATDVFPPTLIPTGSAPPVTAGVYTQSAVAKPYWGTRSIDVDFADVDGDFDLDILVHMRNGYSRIFLNNGDATFTDGTHFTATNTQDPATGAVTQTISTWYPMKRGPYAYNQELCDIDNDGDLDLLIDNAGPKAPGTTAWGPNGSGTNDATQILINNGYGKFTDDTLNRTIGEQGGDDNAVKCADVNNDGWNDIVVSSLSGRSEKLLVNDGTGRLAFVPDGIPYVFSGNAGDPSLGIDMADLNGDKILDLVTGQGETGGSWAEHVYYGAGASQVDTRAPIFRAIETVAPLPEKPTVVRFAVRDNVTSDAGQFVKSASLVYKTAGGALKTVKAVYSGGDMFRAVIPALPAGTDLSYQVTATDRGGIVGTSAFTVVKVLVPDAPPAGGSGGTGSGGASAGTGGTATGSAGTGGTAGRGEVGGEAGEIGVAGETGEAGETGVGGSVAAGGSTGRAGSTASGGSTTGEAGSTESAGTAGTGHLVADDDGGCSVTTAPSSKGRGAALLGLGLAMLGLVRRRRNGKQ